jgi:hypothetical protein
MSGGGDRVGSGSSRASKGQKGSVWGGPVSTTCILPPDGDLAGTGSQTQAAARLAWPGELQVQDS